MKLEDIANVYIGVVLKRKEAVYKGTKTNKYKEIFVEKVEEVETATKKVKAETAVKKTRKKTKCSRNCNSSRKTGDNQNKI